MLRLRIQDTHAHQSTQQARGHFAEFGISSTQSHAGFSNKQKNPDSVLTYPNQNLDRIPFPEPLFITFTRPLDVWREEDDKFIQKIDSQILSMQSTNQPNFNNAGKGALPKQFFDFSRKIQEMTFVKQKVQGLQDKQSTSRTLSFSESGQLVIFLQHYDMKIEKCLKTLGMDKHCTNGCSEKTM